MTTRGKLILTAIITFLLFLISALFALLVWSEIIKLPFFVVWIAAGIGVVMLIVALGTTVGAIGLCPVCGEGHLTKIDEEPCSGITAHTTISDNSVSTRYSRKYRVTYKCEKCGHITTKYEEHSL
jgi:predicted RNA-binding Zn-ribbon protein involved in translation (DUF1610 family)